MADSMGKVRMMVAGRFHVDSNRIDGDVPRETAPNNIRADEDEGYSYVFEQSGNVDEEAHCRDAVESCPVEATGDNGDEK